MSAARQRGPAKSFDQVAVEKGFLGFRDIERAVRLSQTEGKPIQEILINERLLTDKQVAQIYGEILGKPVLSFSHREEFWEAPPNFPHMALLGQYLCVLLSEQATVFKVAMANPLDHEGIRKIEAALGKTLDVYPASINEIRNELGLAPVVSNKSNRSGGSSNSTKSGKLGDSQRSSAKVTKLSDVKAGASGAGSTSELGADDELGESASERIDEILGLAIEHHASDVHIEAEEDFVRVRMRIDGIMIQQMTLPYELHTRLMARLKVLSHLDIAEKRKAQDGSFRMKLDDKTVDLRISTLPTVRGEKAVIRILDKSNLSVNLSDLGLKPKMVQQIQEVAERPYGIILVTGPTGSGKTTSVYSILNYVNQMDKNIITVEDPVEFQFELMNQVQVNEKAGVTFSNVLRNILRQDPDIIMIGEIRDRETAELAVRAALTGHLVISTIHTNDAIGTVGRLVDMGVEPYLLASALSAVISQRLVRKLCTKCRKAHTITPEERQRLESPLVLPTSQIYSPQGCPDCLNLGYKGRRPVFEMLVPGPEMQQCIAEGASTATIKQLALAAGFESMRQNGVEVLLEGTTTLEEVLRATL